MYWTVRQKLVWCLLHIFWSIQYQVTDVLDRRGLRQWESFVSNGVWHGQGGPE
jgi:hypothetical protein